MSTVSIREETMTFPTYGVGEPDVNPMFLEKRVYQGSSGKVYPFPVIDSLADDKTDKKWRVIVLENEWLEVWLMPDLGGRIQRARDKTNGYDFVYYNQVVKPALVGLAGPWISGGIEFNWPQHHRPSTFLPVEYKILDRGDGAKTLVTSEIDRMYGTKATTFFTLYPDKAYIEIKGRLYNRTDVDQTFLWWANPAYWANEHTRSIFPPDVTAVMDHGKRDVSSFPVARGTYYKIDYSRGVDISRHFNIPVPTSYMAARSDYDFVGGYDDKKAAGLLHVADHHVVPGKKQWTWGNGDFGHAWDRNLTDVDGPYVELMTGVFTDNQPDFSWIEPGEVKEFTQYFMPYKQVGTVKNASRDLVLGLDVDKGGVKAGGIQISAMLYATSTRKGLRVVVSGTAKTYCDTVVDLSPREAWRFESGSAESRYDIEIAVYDADGTKVLFYKEKPLPQDDLPKPAEAIGLPRDIGDTDSLLKAGQHLEQYRHATYDPADYYREGLVREAGHAGLNLAYGILLLRRARIQDAEVHLRRALATMTRHNPNPPDNLALLHLALALELQGKYDEAFDLYYKATWNGSRKDSAFFALARISGLRGDWNATADFARRSLGSNPQNARNRHVLTIALRRCGDGDGAIHGDQQNGAVHGDQRNQAATLAAETLKLDPLDFGAIAERWFLAASNDASASHSNDASASHAKNGARVPASSAGTRPRDALLSALGFKEHNWLELAWDYESCGAREEASRLLDLAAETFGAACGPLVFYHRAKLAMDMGDRAECMRWLERAAKANPRYVFPNRIASEQVLEFACRHNPADARAWYYRGNFWYDKMYPEKAVEFWERSAGLDASFPTVRRNLAIAYFNKHRDPVRALESLEAAERCDPADARIFMELDQLRKKKGVSVEGRLAALRAKLPLVTKRDDLATEYATLLNLAGRHAEALGYIQTRKFHPWEGGEGKIAGQYVRALLGIALEHLRAGAWPRTTDALQNCFVYPENLGEGKLAGAREHRLHYWLGLAQSKSGNTKQAAESWAKAASGNDSPGGVMFYNDQPPEAIFYQGLARRALGDEPGAVERFEVLRNYGREHVCDRMRIDFFAVSLPDFLIFDEDLDRRNELHCKYLIALGSRGIGDGTGALSLLREITALDPAHQGARDHLAWFEEGLL